MILRKRVNRSVLAVILALGLFLTPALPAAADDVGTGWGSMIVDTVKQWVEMLDLSAETRSQKDYSADARSSRDGLRIGAPEADDTDPFQREVPTNRPWLTQEAECDGLPEMDPTGAC